MTATTLSKETHTRVDTRFVQKIGGQSYINHHNIQCKRYSREHLYHKESVKIEEIENDKNEAKEPARSFIESLS